MADIAVVQNPHDEEANFTTNTTTFVGTAHTFTAGNGILVFGTYDSTGGTVSTSLSDNVNGSYPAVLSPTLNDATNASCIFCFWLPGASNAGGSITHTLTLGSARKVKALWYVEISNAVTTGSPLVVVGQTQATVASGTDNITSTLSGTLGSAPAMIVGFTTMAANTLTPTAGTGFTSNATAWRWAQANDTSRAEWQRVTATTSIAATFTPAVTGQPYNTLLVAIAEAAAAGPITAALTATGTVTAGITASAAAASAITAAATPTIAIRGAGAVAAALTAAATIVATLSGAGTQAAALTGSGAVAGELTASGALSASVLTTSTVTGTMPGTAPILANITAAGSVSAGITGAGAIASAITATSTVAADLTVLTSGAMVAALSASGTATGTLAGAGAMSSAVTGQGTLSANLTTAGAMAAALSASASVTGVLGRLITVDLAETVPISELVAGAPATIVSGTAAITATGTVTVAATGAAAVSSAITATGTPIATLSGAGVLACATTAAATVTGTLVGTKLISASLSGAATVTAVLTSGFASVPTFIGVSALATGSGTSLTPNVSGIAIQANDILIFHALINDTAAAIGSTSMSLPSVEGWTQITVGASQVSGNASIADRWYWKRWGVGNTDDTTPTASLVSTPLAWVGAISVWRGCVRGTTPYESTSISAGISSGGGTLTEIGAQADSFGTARVSLRLWSGSNFTGGLASPSEGTLAYGGSGYQIAIGGSSGLVLGASYLTGEPVGNVGSATISGTASSGQVVNLTLVLSPDDLMSSAISGSASVAASIVGSRPLVASITGSAAPSASLLGAGAVAAAITGTATITATIGTAAPITADISSSATVSATLSGSAQASAGVSGTATVTGDLQGFTAGQATAALTATSTVTGTLIGSAAILSSTTAAGSVTATPSGAGALTAAVSATGTATGTLAGDGSIASAISTTSTVTGTAINSTAGLMFANLDTTTAVTADIVADGALASSIATTAGVVGTLVNISRIPGPTSILEQFRDLVGQITASPTPRFHEAGYRRRIEVEPEGGSDHAFTVEAEPMFPGRAAFGSGFVIRRMTVKVRISYVRTGGRRGNRQVINQQATEDGVRLADVCSNPDNYASQSTGIRTVDWEGTRRDTDAGTREVWETRFAVEWSAEFNGSVLS